VGVGSVVEKNELELVQKGDSSGERGPPDQPKEPKNPRTRQFSSESGEGKCQEGAGGMWRDGNHDSPGGINRCTAVDWELKTR